MNPTYDFTGQVALVIGASSGIRPRIRTPRDPDQRRLPRHGEPEEIAAGLWLCSPGTSFIIGVALPVDDGYTARSTLAPPTTTKDKEVC